MNEAITPVAFRQAGPTRLEIDWKDGHTSAYDVRGLRLACRCAQCIEEGTGRPLLVEEEVPADVRPVRLSPVGRYAVHIVWTDGHDSGYYTFDYLRELA